MKTPHQIACQKWYQKHKKEENKKTLDYYNKHKLWYKKYYVQYYLDHKEEKPYYNNYK